MKLPISLILGAIAMLYVSAAFLHWGYNPCAHWNQRRNAWWFTPTFIVLVACMVVMLVGAVATFFAALAMR